MSRYARMLVLFLVAAWLPVTLHCRLEAAGFSHADECCAGEQAVDVAGDCKDDACPTVEDTLFKDSSPSFKVVAPAIVECFACLASLSQLSAPLAEPILSPERHAPPLELNVAWQFLSRAAPPARAPSLNT